MLLLLFFVVASCQAEASKVPTIVVAPDGSGDFRTITEAIQSVPDINLHRVNIFIKNGVYQEKILLNKDNICLMGEDKAQTRIEFNQLKKDWVKNPDAIGAAVLNITADDITITNITLHNTMPKVGPTAYTVYSTGTRTAFINCNIANTGANTMCLMNYKSGMYLVKDCQIEGAVDFFRAMGWCYVEGCSFYQHEAISSIWHAGITSADQKMVVKNSKFDGVQHFFVGRSHYDSQFFLVGCEFSERLADKAFYRKTYEENPAKARNYPNVFGDRYYFADNKQNGTNYAWLRADNLKDYDPKLDASLIDAQFVFGDRWNTELLLTSPD